MILNRQKSQLLVVDIQARLLPVMAEQERLMANVARLCQAARLLDIPITISEQYPKGIGPTVPGVIDACGSEAMVLPKMTFSCLREEALAQRINELGKVHLRRQVVVCGIEAHVCVLQTALDLRSDGFDVVVIGDAISSRTAESKSFAIERMRSHDVDVATTEMAVFEWLERAGTTQFKTLSQLIK
ncbi:isochorismatase family protein [Roseiarcaceae bacterium H3SJ34-1]|uniref:isochorismatase family protein n=1 Tax=Terripilifer ovatus TaxID=3032367 RepID=UPI003AB91BDB|nr:isochorismatase family protein [Roseiarcaceae bacterium H3SJ34-1]